MPLNAGQLCALLLVRAAPSNGPGLLGPVGLRRASRWALLDFDGARDTVAWVGCGVIGAWVLLTSVSIAGDDDLRAALRGSAPHRLAKHLLGHVLFVFALVQASKPLTALADGNDADSGAPRSLKRPGHRVSAIAGSR